MRSVFGLNSLPSIDPVLSVGMQRAPLTRTESVVKRASDIALAGTALVLLSPLMLMTALAIRLHGVGPVMVRRRRAGVFHLQIQNPVGDGGGNAGRSDATERLERHRSGPRVGH